MAMERRDNILDGVTGEAMRMRVDKGATHC